MFFFWSGSSRFLLQMVFFHLSVNSNWFNMLSNVQQSKRIMKYFEMYILLNSLYAHLKGFSNVSFAKLFFFCFVIIYKIRHKRKTKKKILWKQKQTVKCTENKIIMINKKRCECAHTRKKNEWMKSKYSAFTIKYTFIQCSTKIGPDFECVILTIDTKKNKKITELKASTVDYSRGKMRARTNDSNSHPSRSFVVLVLYFELNLSFSFHLDYLNCN